MANFTIEHLSCDQLAEAWPVVRMSHSHANADWWISEAVALIDRGGGVIAARATDGTIHGVATYEIASKARIGRVLWVDLMISFELSRRAPARHALYEALELLAGAFECRSIVLPLPSKHYLQQQAKTLYGVTDLGARPNIG